MNLNKMSYANFVEFFKKKKYFPEGIYFNRNKVERFTEKDFKKYYDNYIKAIEKKEVKLNEFVEIKIDENWQECKRIVDIRDPDNTEFLEKLSEYEKKVLTNKTFNCIDIYDYCHIFGKGCYPKLKYEPDNIIKMPRLVHGSIDKSKCWITDEFLNKEQVEKFWIRFIGQERFNKLKNMI